MATMTTTIFTDGSSRGNPGSGGWGAVVIEGDQVQELGGGEKNTTNNRMELTAAVQGLAHASKTESVKVLTDSSYVINGITKWVHAWQKNDWKTKSKDDVMNKDLWLQLIKELGKRDVTWQYVGGHVGILGNERCDHIATAFAEGRKIKLYKGPLKAYDLPNILDISLDQSKAKAKKSDSARARAKAYSYVSSVGGVIEIHHSWPECEKRVKGVRGARYKKALDQADEQAIISEFGSF
jgi:ribonuclease HI